MAASARAWHEGGVEIRPAERRGINIYRHGSDGTWRVARDGRATDHWVATVAE